MANGGLPYVAPTLFGNDPIQWHIPGVCRQGGDLLKPVGHPDEYRFGEDAPVQQVGKGSIIIPPPHSQTMSRRVECHQWSQDKIQSLGGTA